MFWKKHEYGRTVKYEIPFSGVFVRPAIAATPRFHIISYMHDRRTTLPGDVIVGTSELCRVSIKIFAALPLKICSRIRDRIMYRKTY